MSEGQSIRWGIITTGLISSRFVQDLLLDRANAPVKHVVQAIGSSSQQKAEEFAAKYCANAQPTLYGSYQQVYDDAEVQVVYIGTPHAFHKRECLNAIAGGKHVLCEKPFTINAREAREVFDAASKEGVYVHEAMWLRHRPLFKDLQRLLHEEKVIGDVFRVVAEFGLEIDIPNLPETSRYKDLNLGAGTLLDLGVYPLTWALMALDPGTPSRSERPDIAAVQTHQDGIEVTTSILLRYPSSGRQGIVMSTSMAYQVPWKIASIHGTNGSIEVEGPAPSLPFSFTVYPKQLGDAGDNEFTRPEGKKHDYPKIGRGFVYEADATALDILAGRSENATMPWSETISVMEMMDEIRRQGGTKYPADQ